MTALDPDLLAVLACPAADHGRLRVDGPADRPESLTCTVCARRYPIEHETAVPIPVLLLDPAEVV